MFKSFFGKFMNKLSKPRAKDPVCGMEARNEINIIYKGRTHSFCSSHCREQFQKEPESYESR